MPAKKVFVVKLEESERQTLEEVVVARRSPQGEVLRARIVLTCAQYPRSTDAKIASFLGCSPKTVKKWRRRWCQTRKIQEAPRSGRPRVFPPEVRASATALACSLPADSGLPFNASINSATAAGTVWRFGIA